MRYILTILVFGLLFIGCADKNAFTRFNMQAEQELSADNLQSSKIKKDEEVAGIVSAIYLNKIYPDAYSVQEYFYVYLYQKEKQKMHNPNDLEDIKLTLKLNGKLPIKIKELDAENRFSHLSSVSSQWQRYYLVAFNKEEKNELSLVLESGQSFSDPLIYQKDEQ